MMFKIAGWLSAALFAFLAISHLVQGSIFAMLFTFALAAIVAPPIFRRWEALSAEKMQEDGHDGSEIRPFSALAVSWLAVIVIMIFAAPDAGDSNSDSEWYAGGSLHSASIEEWHAASHRNRLATAADWVVAQIGREAAAPLLHNSLEELSEAVVTCVDEGTEGVSEKQNQSASEAAAMCMILMKYPAKPR